MPVRQPDWIASAPVQVTETRHIAAAPEAVWAHIADHERWPEWFTALKSVRVTTGAEGVGGGREVSVPGMAFGEVFTAWEPGRQFAFSVIRANRTLASMAESVELTEADGGCTLVYRQGIEPARGFGWLWRLLRGRLHKNLAAALEALGTRAETT